MDTIKFFVQLFYVYLLVGIVFALVFVWRGIAKIDDSAKGISWKTRLFLFPGSAALWPFLLQKSVQAARQRAASAKNPGKRPF